MSYKNAELYKSHYTALQAHYKNNDLDSFKKTLDKAVVDGFTPEKTVLDTLGRQSSLLRYILNEAISGNSDNTQPDRIVPFLEVILSCMRNVDAPFSYYSGKYSGLHYLLIQDMKNIEDKLTYLRLFLKHGADVNLLSEPVRIAMDISLNVPRPMPAIFFAHEPEIIEELLNAGADINYVTPTGLDVLSHYLTAYMPYNNDSAQKLKKKFSDRLKAIGILLQNGALRASNAQYNPLLVLSKLRKMVFDFNFERCYSDPTAENFRQKTENMYLQIFDKFTVKVCDMMIKAGADLKAEDHGGNNVVNLCGSYTLLKKFLDLGCDVSHKNKDGETLLNALAEITDPKDRHKAKMPESDWTLMKNEYIARGGIIDPTSDYYYGRTPMFNAVCRTDDALVRELAVHGADINKRDKIGTTPVSQCFTIGTKNKDVLCKFNMIKTLDELGADMTVIDNEGETLLHKWASAVSYFCQNRKRNLQIEQDEKNADIYITILDFILAHGVDINARDNDGHTAAWHLVYGVTKGKIPYVMRFLTQLMERGADLEIKDNDKQTVLDLIPYKKYTKQVTEMLNLRHSTNNMIEEGLYEYER